MFGKLARLLSQSAKSTSPIVNKFADPVSRAELQQLERAIAKRAANGEIKSATIHPPLHEDTPIIYDKSTHDYLLSKRPNDKGRQDFLNSMGHIRTIQNPTSQADVMPRDVRYLYEGVNNDGSLGKVALKPIQNENRAYISTAHIIKSPARIKKELARTRGVLAPSDIKNITDIRNFTPDDPFGRANVNDNVTNIPRFVNRNNETDYINWLNNLNGRQ